MAQAIAPLAAELLRAARQEAGQVRARANDEATTFTSTAQEQAEELVATAHAEGVAEAGDQARAEQIRMEREARRLVLAAQRGALSEFRRRARQAARELRNDPALLARLRDLVRNRVGPDALVIEHPDGGIVGEAPGRRVDAGLAALADRAIDGLGAEVERLWLP
ncbi:V-type ATP synthase subunit E family protein [Nonomuraea basaltis]|uniref:V-type ATP synthase subunit E family protein n=1 Tax=Nonomuraea basaltis TaxID=2495887 RepID=UPI001F10783C|nr:V-type ATP synthase subunit E family protein [Nonomuraea basaltis]